MHTIQYNIGFYYVQLLFSILNNIIQFMRTAFFWVITQQVMIISYRCFGATNWSHLQGSTSWWKPEIMYNTL